MQNKEFVDCLLDYMGVFHEYYSPEVGSVYKDCYGNVFYYPGSIVMYYFNRVITRAMKKQSLLQYIIMIKLTHILKEEGRKKERGTITTQQQPKLKQIHQSKKNR